nr:MAG TPA: hypothetical protein [Caudoviricetes sp.]
MSLFKGVSLCSQAYSPPAIRSATATKPIMNSHRPASRTTLIASCSHRGGVFVLRML